MNMNVTEELIGNILEITFETFPKDIVERAKDEVADVIGCSIGGATDTGSPMVVDLVREWGGKEESTVLAHGVRAPSQLSFAVGGVHVTTALHTPLSLG